MTAKVIPFPRDHGSKGQTRRYPKPSAPTVERPCLCCGAPFPSEGKHNRLCSRCRHRDLPVDMPIRTPRR